MTYICWVSSHLPHWLEVLFTEKFHACIIHEDERKKNENNIYCLDSCTSLCPHCLSFHASHCFSISLRRANLYLFCKNFIASSSFNPMLVAIKLTNDFSLPISLLWFHICLKIQHFDCPLPCWLWFRRRLPIRHTPYSHYESSEIFNCDKHS